MNVVRVAALQFDPQIGEVDRNLEMLGRAVAAHARAGWSRRPHGSALNRWNVRSRASAVRDCRYRDATATRYRGRDALTGTPPSEPDRRFSRIRLSGWECYHQVDWNAKARACTNEKSPR